MEFKKAVQQKKKIDQMRIRIEIIKLAKLWLDRKKEEQHLQGLLQTINNLKMVEAEYNAKVAKAVEERRAELRDRQIFGRSGSSMPKIDLSSIKKHWYIQNTKNPFEPFNLPMQIRTRTIDADEMSVNSLMLEEMCTEDNTTMQHVPLSNASITEEVEEQQEPAQSLGKRIENV
ncbi:uncharacterized protein LOC105698010 [Orussus abietinus]|uniref:uncharacterized protein LOC105698010 n=1 Tax=Orussus abietinus TaxID=222816 RepID=UPI000626E70C|nr:uncharacterized protein LOC105698010 [Orussus abietinus]